MEDSCFSEAIPLCFGLGLIGFSLPVQHKFILAQSSEKRTLQFSYFPFALNDGRPADIFGKRKRGGKNMGGKMVARRVTGKTAKSIVRYRLT